MIEILSFSVSKEVLFCGVVDNAPLLNNRENYCVNEESHRVSASECPPRRLLVVIDEFFGDSVRVFLREGNILQRREKC